MWLQKKKKKGIKNNSGGDNGHVELTWLEIHINEGRFVSIEATRDKAIVCVCVCVCVTGRDFQSNQNNSDEHSLLPSSS